MKKQVILSKKTGRLGVAAPLFSLEDNLVDELPNYQIHLTAYSAEPVIYAVDIGENSFEFMDAKFLEKHKGIIWLGEF